jgi:hypothetical protein
MVCFDFGMGGSEHNRTGNELMILDCPNMDQCVYLHGSGPHDLQLHRIRHNYEGQGLAVRVVFCALGDCVGLLFETRAPSSLIVG